MRKDGIIGILGIVKIITSVRHFHVSHKVFTQKNKSLLIWRIMATNISSNSAINYLVI